MPGIESSRLFIPRPCLILIVAVSFFKTCSLLVAQDDSSAAQTTQNQPMELRAGPFDLHPRLVLNSTYDDNILLSPFVKEADEIWMVQPALQAVAGDDPGLIAYRDQNNNVLRLTPGDLIVQRPDDRVGKLFILDYGPRFQIFDKYTANNSIDEFATLDLLWPMNKLILGLKQDYQYQKEQIIEADTRTTVTLFLTTLSAAYEFGDKTSMESDFHRSSISYQAPGLIGYTEYNTEDWFNYKVEDDLPVSLGLLGGVDDVPNHQDEDYEQIRARVRYLYSEKLAFDVSGGGELREYQNGNPDKLFPVFTVAAEYRPAERTTLVLTGFRQQYASIINGYTYSSLGATLAVRQGVTDRFTVLLEGGYYDIDYTPITRGVVDFSEDYFTARLGLEAKISHRLQGQVFYQLLNAQSQVRGNLSDTQAGLQVTLNF
jgi:hypothetical protein